MAITPDRLSELEEEYADAYMGLENPLKEVPPELLPYLPNAVQDNIRMGDRSYVRREHYAGIVAAAEEERAAELAKRNDPDALGFGDTRDPEHTLVPAPKGSTKQHELMHRGASLIQGPIPERKALAPKSYQNRLPLWDVHPISEEHLYIAATQDPERLDFYRERAGLADLPDVEFDAYLQTIIDEYSKLPDLEEAGREGTPSSTYQFREGQIPGEYLYPESNYPYDENTSSAGGYYDEETDEIVYPLEEKDGGPLYAAEGESIDRVAEIEDEENLQDEENWGTKTAEFLIDMLPSEEKSWGENIFDIATLAVPPLRVLKAAKVADPVLDSGIMQMANKGKTYGGGFTKPGMTKIRGGGGSHTFKTRNPVEWDIYTDIARFSDGGTSPGKLTPQQVDQLREIMPKLRAAASSQKRHGRTTMNNVVRMFDENFK